MTTPICETVAIAVETSGGVGSVAVGRGDTVLADEAFDARNRHGVALLPTVERLARGQGIAPESIDHVYVSAGPGSFTGLRIGITFGRTLAFAVGARVVRVPSLEAIVQNALQTTDPPRRVAVLLDAKRDHVFAGCFELAGGAYIPIDSVDERAPRGYLAKLGTVAVLGEWAGRHRALLAEISGVTVLPDAMHEAQARVVYSLGRKLAERGVFTSLPELTPIYVRRPEAEERWEMRHSDGGRANSG